MTEQGKLDILINNFGKLEESRKEYISELTRKLADIHGENRSAFLTQGQNSAGDRKRIAV